VQCRVSHGGLGTSSGLLLAIAGGVGRFFEKKSLMLKSKGSLQTPTHRREQRITRKVWEEGAGGDSTPPQQGTWQALENRRVMKGCEGSFCVRAKRTGEKKSDNEYSATVKVKYSKARGGKKQHERRKRYPQVLNSAKKK